MTMLTVNDGIRNQILEVDWNTILESTTSTEDTEDYGDYAIIDNFIGSIDELYEACLRYPADARSKIAESSHIEFGEFKNGYKFPGIEQLLPSDYFTPLLFSCYKSFIECEFIPHDLDCNICDEGKYKFMQKLPRISLVKGTLLHEGMIINKNADAPGLGNFDFQATLFLNEPPEGSGLGLYDLVFNDDIRCSGIEDLVDIEDNNDKAGVGKWLNENAVCEQETVEYRHNEPDNHWDQTRFIPAKKNRLILHKGTIFQKYEYLGQGDLYMLNIYMNQPPKSKEFIEGNQIESDTDNY